MQVTINTERVSKDLPKDDFYRLPEVILIKPSDLPLQDLWDEAENHNKQLKELKHGKLLFQGQQ
jgi:hypothetical protein